MIKINKDNSGWRIDVMLKGKVQRTAWMPDFSSANRVAKEFANNYGKDEQPLEVHMHDCV